MDFDSPEFQDYLEKVRDVPMVDICEDLGIEVSYKNGKAWILCPFHNDTHVGSCMIKNNTMYCFACGASADNIKLIQHVRNDLFLEACNYIADRAGISKPVEHKLTEQTAYQALPITDEQLSALGLTKYGSALDITSFATTSTDFDKSKDDFEFDADGYCIGTKVKFSIRELYQDDPMGFHCLIIGKCFERLMDLLSRYYTEDFPDLSFKTINHLIWDVLWPLASYYKPVAQSYGYDFSFMDRCQKRTSAFLA